jgi:aerobic-type carbon monoxide dehydrogenase small subunit (CoxS/CutS family)
VEISVTVNGVTHTSDVEPRTLLVHYIREQLGLTGTNIGCDTSSCGACTLHVDGESVKSCTMLAVQADGHDITTIEGLASADGALHPMQQAFIDLDAFQCGYCTPGQICSAVGMLDEIQRGVPSAVGDLAAAPQANGAEIRERMSGNICRCSAYPNIVAAIQEVSAQAPLPR